MVKPGLAYLDTIPSCDAATWLRQGGGGQAVPCALQDALNRE